MLGPQAEEMRIRLGADEDLVDRWLERCFELSVAEDLDWPLFPRMGRIGPRMIEVIGREHLDESLARGHGVVIYSGHFFGHFTAPVALAHLGYRMNVAGLFRNLQNPDDDQWYPSRRQAFVESLGCRLIRMHEQGIGATRGATVALRANEVVMTLIDHTPIGQMVTTPFLGAPGFFPSGPAWLARMSGAPLVFFDVRRPLEQLPQRMEFGPPYWVDDDIDAAVAHMASRLEAAIRADPPSWGPWLYPRKFVWSPVGSR
jgi:lauroyl/myristoyl acyltransferase